ncbi:hypothetical protein NXS19_013006 [Fusarium pseudograminearum]|nr:hypothetical protein NXS19_013006 [Fusarium pseudograminearum]
MLAAALLASGARLLHRKPQAFKTPLPTPSPLRSDLINETRDPITLHNAPLGVYSLERILMHGRSLYTKGRLVCG